MSLTQAEVRFAKACREIIEELLKYDKLDHSIITKVKKEVSHKYRLSKIPANYEILSLATDEELSILRPFLLKKPVRSISGVTVIAVMTKPFPCPHGRCVYCPGGPGSVLGDVPQSYTGYEPATLRGIQNQYDPYRQVRSRIMQLLAIGHVPSKVELIIMGGTFPATPREYQEWFVKGCLDALNSEPSKSLEEAQLKNERAKIRNVGMTIETRPDYSKEPHVDMMLKLGATRVELGVQTVYDWIYEKVERGHTIQDVIEATRILKDSGLKVCYHMMPGLPGSNFEMDLDMFKTIFEDPRFKPDMLKIYPTVVVKGTKLYEWWRRGEYRALSEDEVIELISEMYRYIPKWVRIMRIQRDVPAQYIEAGPKKGNLREYVERKALEKGIRIREIRYREVGRALYKRGIAPKEVVITKEYYEASGGIEVFIAAEDPINDILVGLLRLRIPSEKAHRPEVDARTAIVRELHVYGPQVPVGHSDPLGWQHRGWGRRLLETAEEVARYEFSARKILVLSGVGVREYYRKLGYFRPSDSPYMTKFLA